MVLNRKKVWDVSLHELLLLFAYLRMNFHLLQENLEACCIVGLKSTLINNYFWTFAEVVALHQLKAE